MIAETALSLWTRHGKLKYISLGCEILDNTIGGISKHGITEIAGEAGCGKTQLCLSLALQAQLDEMHGGLCGATAYICGGEGVFPIQRMSQMTKIFALNTGLDEKQLLLNIHIEQAHNIDEVFETLNHKIPDMCAKNNIKLLVIDSIAGLIRPEFDVLSAKELSLRTATLVRLAAKLKWVSDIFGVAVVVVNQVVANFDSDQPPQQQSSFKPALGMVWAQCVNSRVILRKGVYCEPSLAASSSDHLLETPSEPDKTSVHPSMSQIEVDRNQFYGRVDGVDDSCGTSKCGEDDWKIAYFPEVVSAAQQQAMASAAGPRSITLDMSPCRPRGTCRYLIIDRGLRGCL